MFSLRTFLAFSVFGMVAFGAVVPVKMKSPEVKFLSFSAPTREPLENLLGSGDVHSADANMHNIKLSVVFDRPLAIRKVQLDSCSENDWTDSIDVLSSPGSGRVFVEGGRKTLAVTLKSSGPVEAIAIVFGRNADLCLKNLRFFSDGETPLPLVGPKSAAASLSLPLASLLFDSHPGTAFSLEDPVHIKFEEKKTYDRALIWTGSSPLFAHSLKLKGEKGWSETLPLRASPSEQEIIFKKPFTGRELTLQAPDAGEIAEIRFATQTKVEAVAPDRASTTSAAVFKKQFAEAGLQTVLDSKWMTMAEEKWTFLFRSDGTFFIDGFSDDSKQAGEYSALGAYTIVRYEKNKVRLKINGVRFATGSAWDGVACPFACGIEGTVETSTSVVDSVVLEKAGEGSVMIRNRTPHARRTLTFGDLRIRRGVED